MIIAGLVVALLLSLVYIAYKEFGRKRSTAQKQLVASATLIKAISDLLAALPNADASTKQRHRELADRLVHATRNDLPTDADLKHLFGRTVLPRDYEYFIRECLPRFRDKADSKGTPIKDRNVLMSFGRGMTMKPRLIVNDQNAPVAALRKLCRLDEPGNRIAFAAAYTSPFNMPAGLMIADGKVVNPAVQHFDGILVFGDSGNVEIMSVDALHVGLHPLDIIGSLRDYQELLGTASRSRLSVIQGTLLVKDGRVLVETKGKPAAIPRRVLFATEDHGLHLYDSLGQPQTLFEVAQVLREKFRAQRAFNLETGPYNFCQVKSDNRIVDYSHVQPGTIVSNVIVIEF